MLAKNLRGLVGRSALACAFVLACSRTPGAAAVTGDAFHPARVSTPIVLDGALGDSRWQSASRAGGLMDAASHAAARSQTEAAVYYDDRNLYVAFWCKQTVPLTASQMTNNVGFGSDDFAGIGIDPSGNGDRAYYFEVTPNGTRFAQSTESARYVPRWDGRSHRSADGWTAMMVIPLRAMKLASSSPQTWRLNFVRGVIVGGEKQTWSYDGRMDGTNAFPALTDARYWRAVPGWTLSASSNAPKSSVDIYTLAAGGLGRSQFIAPDGASFSQNPRAAGLDVVYPLAGTMSLVGTLNPDFSNVDADQLTIAPQIFQRNLTEYRPFFAQGANFINNSATAYGINEPPNVTFYSPSIGSFDRGVKVEGTYGAYQSLGLLEARGTNAVTGQPFDDMAFGWKHVLPGKAFGYWTNGVVANHGSLRDSTMELGVQARDLSKGWVGALFHEGENAVTPTERYSASSTYGFIDQQNGSHEAIVGFRNIGPRFDPVDGFTQISDIHGMGASYSLFGPGSPNSALSAVKNGYAYVYGDRYFDGSGAVHKADAGLAFYATLNADYSINVGTNQTEVRSYAGDLFGGYPAYADPRDLRFDSSFVSVGVHPNSPARLNLQYSWGPFGDFYLQQITAGGARPVGPHTTFSWEYDGTRERLFAGDADGQWLRKAALTYSLGPDASFSLALRTISGEGGMALPGTNFSETFHRIFANGNELYAAFGTPSAVRTIDRVLVKYVFKSAESLQ